MRTLTANKIQHEANLGNPNLCRLALLCNTYERYAQPARATLPQPNISSSAISNQTRYKDIVSSGVEVHEHAVSDSDSDTDIDGSDSHETTVEFEDAEMNEDNDDDHVNRVVCLSSLLPTLLHAKYAKPTTQLSLEHSLHKTPAPAYQSSVEIQRSWPFAKSDQVQGKKLYAPVPKWKQSSSIGAN
jgi:hypothetical protein